MPNLGEGITGVLTRYLVDDREPILQDQVILEIETDKAIYEIDADRAGVLKTVFR
jgi:2-oxoglutarate dehydrogenase E2 component (dihydrolipoamide succinyltransferase)